MASGRKEKLHRTVLSRCLPSLVQDLDFKAVSIYIYQKELFDDITLRDISEQKLTSDKVRELILRLQQRDQNTYDKFKDCLVSSKQEYLKDILEMEETKVYNEGNNKQKEKEGFLVDKEKHEVQHTETARETKTQDIVGVAVAIDAPVNVESVVIRCCDDTSHESVKHPDVDDRAALWLTSLSTDLPGPDLWLTSLSTDLPGPEKAASKPEYKQDSVQQQLASYQEQEEKPNDFQSEKRCDTQNKESMEADCITHQADSNWGIYEKAKAWYDLVICKKVEENKPKLKAIRQEVLQNPAIKSREISENKESLWPSETFDACDGPMNVGPTSYEMRGYCPTVKDNLSGSGPVITPSVMHNFKSYNDIHEKKGKRDIGEQNSTPDLSSYLSLDGKVVLKEHYDVCVIFSDEDEDDAYMFIDHLKQTDLGGNVYPKICRYNDEGIWGLTTKINRVPLVSKHCSLIFVFISNKRPSDSYTTFFHDEVVMSSLKGLKVRPVLSEENCTLPAGMHNIPPIKWYRRGTRAYQENIRSILDYSMKFRLQREKMSVQSILPDFS